MSDKKPKTIRMTDEAFNIVSRKAKERNLPVGDFILESVSAEQKGISPEIICRILTIGELVRIPMEQWNDRMKELYSDCVEGLCVLLKW